MDVAYQNLFKTDELVGMLKKAREQINVLLVASITKQHRVEAKVISRCFRIFQPSSEFVAGETFRNCTHGLVICLIKLPERVLGDLLIRMVQVAEEKLESFGVVLVIQGHHPLEVVHCCLGFDLDCAERFDLALDHVAENEEPWRILGGHNRNVNRQLKDLAILESRVRPQDAKNVKVRGAV